MTKVVTDEQISAYLDGAGDPETCEYIDRALEQDAALRARIDRLKHAGRLLRDAVDAGLGPVPERLERIAAGTAVTAPSGAGRSPRWLAPYAAMAASILIAFGAGIALGRLPGTVSPPAVLAFGASGLAAGPDLAQAISSAYSGPPVATPVGDVAIALSFRSAKGDFCRRFRLDRAEAAATGVACRHGGLWLIEGWTANRPATKRSAFATASGPPDPAIEAVIDRLGVEKSLNRADEAKAIAQGWRNGRR